MFEEDDDNEEIVINTDAAPPVIGVIIIYGVMLVAGLLLCFFGDIALIPVWKGQQLAIDLGIGVGIGILLVVISGLLRARTSLFDALEEAVRQRLGGLGRRDIIALALFSSVAEEVFFRGFLQTKVALWSGSDWTGIVLTSLFFGLLHSAPRARFWPWTLFATICGLILGWLWFAQGSILAPVAVHFLVNAVNMARILEGTESPAHDG